MKKMVVSVCVSFQSTVGTMVGVMNDDLGRKVYGWQEDSQGHQKWNSSSINISWRTVCR